MANKKGVSLMVLVITIVIMSILVTAVVLTLKNSKGVIVKADGAVEMTDEATIKHLAEVKWAEAYTKKLRTQGELEEYVLKGLKNAGINTDDYMIKVTTNGVTVKAKRICG